MYNEGERSDKEGEVKWIIMERGREREGEIG